MFLAVEILYVMLPHIAQLQTSLCRSDIGDTHLQVADPGV